MNTLLFRASDKLKDLTPLKTDCGRVCGARCCRSMDGEETGMLLFPGEAERYAGKDGWTIRHTERGDLVICPGICRREERPLACRLFPLLPVIGKDGTVTVKTDQRARAVCPLIRHGREAMDPAFLSAVREAGEMLAGDETQAAFLRALAEEQEEIRQLRRLLSGKGGQNCE